MHKNAWRENVREKKVQKKVQKEMKTQVKKEVKKEEGEDGGTQHEEDEEEDGGETVSIGGSVLTDDDEEDGGKQAGGARTSPRTQKKLTTPKRSAQATRQKKLKVYPFLLKSEHISAIEDGSKQWEGRLGSKTIVNDRKAGDSVVYIAGRKTLRRMLAEVRQFDCASDMIRALGHVGLLPSCCSQEDALVTYATMYKKCTVTLGEARQWDRRIRAGPNSFIAWRHHYQMGTVKRDLEELQAKFRETDPEDEEHLEMHRQLCRVFSRATGKPYEDFKGETAERWIKHAILRETPKQVLVFCPDWDLLYVHNLAERPRHTLSAVSLRLSCSITGLHVYDVVPKCLQINRLKDARYDKAYAGAQLINDSEASLLKKDLNAAHHRIYK